MKRKIKMISIGVAIACFFSVSALLFIGGNTLVEAYGGNETVDGLTPMSVRGNIPVKMNNYLTIHLDFDISYCYESDYVFRINKVDASTATIDFGRVFTVSHRIPYDYCGWLPDRYEPFAEEQESESMAIIHHVEDGVLVYLHRYVMYLEFPFGNIDEFDEHNVKWSAMYYARVSFIRTENGALRIETASWHPQWTNDLVRSYIIIA